MIAPDSSPSVRRRCGHQRADSWRWLGAHAADRPVRTCSCCSCRPCCSARSWLRGPGRSTSTRACSPFIQGRYIFAGMVGIAAVRRGWHTPAGRPLGGRRHLRVGHDHGGRGLAPRPFRLLGRPRERTSRSGAGRRRLELLAARRPHFRGRRAGPGDRLVGLRGGADDSSCGCTDPGRSPDRHRPRRRCSRRCASPLPVVVAEAPQ